MCLRGIDPDEVDPFTRMGWRRQGAFSICGAKRACRLQGGLKFDVGYHHALVNDRQPREQVALGIRHFPNRTADQFVRKNVNGSRAIGLTDYDSWVCGHWRDAGKLSESQLIAQFETTQQVSDPHRDASLVSTPAPVERDPERRKRALEL